MKIDVKPEVRFKEINDHTRTFFECLSALGDALGMARTITSANDGTHQGSATPGAPSNSLHYWNLAWDVRSWDLTDREKTIAMDFMKSVLGKDWDVILENENCDKEHFHVEFDPKDIK